MRGGEQLKEKKYIYFDRILDIFLIPGNIRKITVKFLEFVPLPLQTIFKESELYFKMETDGKYPSAFKIPTADVSLAHHASPPRATLSRGYGSAQLAETHWAVKGMPREPPAHI